MCVKVDNFLGCASLENFGLIHGCLHLVILLTSAGSLCVLNPYLLFTGACKCSPISVVENLFYFVQVVWSIVGSIFLAAILFTVYVCVEFIHGVIQVDSYEFVFFKK